MAVEVFTVNLREVIPSLSLIKFVALGASRRIANEASVNIVANVCSAYRTTQKTLIDVNASFPISSKFEAFGTNAHVRSVQIFAVMRTNWLDLSTFVDVDAGFRESVVRKASKTSDFWGEKNISRFHWVGVFDRGNFSDNYAGQPLIYKPIASQSVFIEMESKPASLSWNAVKATTSVDTNLRLKTPIVPDRALVDIFT